MGAKAPQGAANTNNSTSTTTIRVGLVGGLEPSRRNLLAGTFPPEPSRRHLPAAEFQPSVTPSN